MATKNPNDLSAQDPNTIATGDPRDAPYGGIHEGAAPPGAHQNPDGSWDWNTPASPTSQPTQGAPTTSSNLPPAQNITAGVQGGTNASPTGAISTTAPGTNPPTTINDVFRQSLLSQMQGPTPDQVAASAGDSGVVRAYDTAQARAYDTNRANAAEAAAAAGYTGSCAQNTQAAGLAQTRAENEAQFTGQTALTLMNNRRADLQNALTMAQNAGQFDAAQGLQSELAQLDAEITKRGQDIAQQTALSGQQTQATTAANQTNAQLTLGQGDLGLRLGNTQAMGQLGLGYQQESDAVNEAMMRAGLNSGNFSQTA